LDKIRDVSNTELNIKKQPVEKSLNQSNIIKKPDIKLKEIVNKVPEEKLNTSTLKTKDMSNIEIKSIVERL